MISISATYDNDYRNRRDDIYIMDDDGKNTRCLTVTSNLSTYRKLHWLMDNKIILLASYTPTEQFYLISVENGFIRPFMQKNEQKLIRKITYDQKAFFSTHGHYWMVPINGTIDDRVELVVKGMLVGVSSDGQWIAFYQEETPDYVYVQKLNTSYMQQIPMSYIDQSEEHNGDPRTVVWSPDSRYLAYEANYQELWVMRVDGTHRRKVGELNYFWLQFRWSPDSTSIAFIGSVRADEGGGPAVAAAPLYVTRIDDPIPRYLAVLRREDDSGGMWDWMSDGEHLVYATHLADEAKLYKINIRTGNQYLLTDSGHPFAAIYDVAVSS